MSTSQERLAKLKAAALPRVIARIAEDPAHKDRSKAALELMATRKLDKALLVAEAYHLDHPGEDPDIHTGAMLGAFVKIGIPALEAIDIVNEIAKKEPAQQ